MTNHLADDRMKLPGAARMRCAVLPSKKHVLGAQRFAAAIFCAILGKCLKHCDI